MKHLAIFFTLISSTLFAQKDSLRYSEEQAKTFEKPTFIDEYEKAFGGNRTVRTAFKIGLGSTNNSPLSTVFPFYDYNGYQHLPLNLSFEQKISKDFSLNFSANFLLSTYGFPNSPIYKDYSLNLEGRWFYQMKNRILMGKQADNLNGNYLGFRLSNYSFNSTYTFSQLIPKQTFLLTLGKQFGANVDIGIYAGLQYAREADIRDSLLYNDLNSPNRLSFVMGTYTHLGLGLLFPQKNSSINADKCEFMRCNYAVNHLFKFNVNDIIYIDKFRQQLNLNVGFEQKIAHSAFSINTNFGVLLRREQQNRMVYNPNKIVYDENGYSTGAYQYSPDFKSFTTLTFLASMQLRYYPFMKYRMTTRHTANNLSGTYLGLSQEYYSNTIFPKIGDNSYSLFHNALTIGHQQQVSHNFYIDYGLTFDSHRSIDATNRIGLEYFLKLGFAK